MPSKPAAGEGPDPIRPDDLVAISAMTRIADRASRLRSRTAATPAPVAAPVHPAMMEVSAVPASAADLHSARVLLSEQNSVVGSRLSLIKRVAMRGSRTFTHRLVAASRSLADAIERLETTHGTAIGELQRQLAGPYAAMSAVQESDRAARNAESARRDLDTQSLAYQITSLQTAQSRMSQEQSRFADRLLAQLTSMELGVEDAGTVAGTLQDNIRGLAAQLSALERMSAHDRSEMQRTRTLVNRLVRTAGGPLDGTHQGAPGETTPTDLVTRVQAAPALDDGTYVDFEHRFRGSRDEIRARQKDAVQFVIGLAGAKAPLVDLGCGRGEWLDVARELDIPAYGIDSNAAMVAEATAAGLDARVDDALGHLAQLEESTLQAVSAFHFVEHVPIDVLVELLDAALVALRPGGTLLLETPNPTNLVVGAASFFLDPTHQRVLHPDFLAFLVESRGFVDVQVHFVHPVVEASVLEDGHIDGLEDSARLRRMVNGVEWALFGPQDYLLIARRAEVAL